MTFKLISILLSLSLYLQVIPECVFAEELSAQQYFSDLKSGKIDVIQMLDSMSDDEKLSIGIDEDRYSAISVKNVLAEQIHVDDGMSIDEFVTMVNARLENLVEIKYVPVDRAIAHQTVNRVYTDVSGNYNQALSNRNQLYLIADGFDDYDKIAKIKMKVSVGGESGRVANLIGYSTAELPDYLVTSDESVPKETVINGWDNFDESIKSLSVTKITHNINTETGYDIIDIINDRSQILGAPLTIKFDYGAFTCIYLNGAADNLKFKYMLYYDRTIELENSLSRGRYVDGVYVPENSVLSYYTDEDIKSAADKLFSMLNPDSTDTADVYKLYKLGHYKEAMTVFRNYMIERMRSTPIVDVLANIGGYTTLDRSYQADALVGYMTLEELNAKTWEHRDVYGYLKEDNIPVDNKMDINWIAENEYYTNENGESYAYDNISQPAYRGICGILAAKYASTKDDIYLKKFFQVMESYCTQFREQYMSGTENMTDEELMSWAMNGHEYGFVPLPAKYAYANIQYTQKACDIIGGLGVILKAMPCEENKSYARLEDYNSEKAVFEKPLIERISNMVDPIRFANMSYHLIKGERYRLRSYIISSNHVINQEIDGLTSFIRYSCMFKDFLPCTEDIEEACKVINTKIAEIFHADGGLLEKSFGYNAGTVSSVVKISDFLCMASEFEPYLGKNRRELEMKWNRLVEGYKSNLGILPNIGNIGNYGVGRIWEDQNLKQNIENQTAKNRELAYTSIAFPYSGFTAMRDNWNVDGLYMSFFNNNYRSNGHKIVGTNGIMNVTAYGRTMLISGGTPWYGKNYAAGYPTFVSDWYNEINSYMLETSTRKISTVMVNGMSQASLEYQFADDGSFKKDLSYVSVAPEDPLPFKWSSSENFDFNEGKWEGGYTRLDRETELYGEGWTKENSTERPADHKRQIIFVKEAGLWVVLDEMKNVNGNVNSYSQIWNFAPVNSQNTIGGFSDEQVVLNDNENLIKTTDSNSPNLELLCFSNSDLSYQKYYGYKKAGEVALGWSEGDSSAENSRYTPRADVYVNWSDSGVVDKASRVATVIAPSPGSESIIQSKTDLSDSETTGFEIITTDGYKIRYYSNDEVKSYNVGENTVSAKSILIVDDGSVQKGIVLDCTEFNYLTPEYDSFEFLVKDSSYELTEIAAPTRFTWAEFEKDNGETEYLPLYNDDQYYEYMQNEKGFANIETDYANLNRNTFENYMNTYSDYMTYLGVDMEAFAQIEYPEYVFDEIGTIESAKDFAQRVNSIVNGFFYDTEVSIDKITHKNFTGGTEVYTDVTNNESGYLYIGYVYLTLSNVEDGEAIRKVQIKLSCKGDKEQYGAPVSAYSAAAVPTDYQTDNWNAYDAQMINIESFKIPKGTGNVGTVADYCKGYFENNTPLTIKLGNTGHIFVYLNNTTEERQPKIILTYDKTVDMHETDENSKWSCIVKDINKTVSESGILVSDAVITVNDENISMSVYLAAYKDNRLVTVEQLSYNKPQAGNELTISINKTYNADDVKMFIWHSVDLMKPLSPCK